MIKRLFTELTPFIALSFQGEGQELFLKGLGPFNLPLMKGLSKEG